MSYFTEVQSAIEEAECCAEQEDRPQAIVSAGAGYDVMPLFMARYRRLTVLETISHAEDAA